MIGKRIFEIILKNKISSKDFAKSIKIDVSTLSKWINNEIMPSTNNIIKICEVYNIDANWLLGIKK